MRRHIAWRIARRVAPLGLKYAAQAAMNSHQRSMRWNDDYAHEHHGPPWVARARRRGVPGWSALWSEWQPELAELFGDGFTTGYGFGHRHHRHGWQHRRRIRKAIALGLALQAARALMAMAARRTRGEDFGPGRKTRPAEGGHHGGDWGGGPFPFDGRGPRFWGKFGERILGRGDMKFAILDLLRERPMHGYEIIKEMENRSGGMYSPSPGSIYPTLQLLEDRGFVSGQATEGRTIYTITDSGRAFLQSQLENVEAMRGHKHRSPHEDSAEDRGPWKGDFGPKFGRGFNFGEGFDWRNLDRQEVRAIVADMREIGRIMVMIFRSSAGDPSKLAALHNVLRRTRDDLDSVLHQDRSGEPPVTTL